MPPVTGDPQLGGEEAADVANHEKGRPPDEISEDDRMDTSSRRFPFVSMSNPSNFPAKDSEQLGPSASRKGKRKLDSEETYPHFPDGFQSEDEESGDALGPSRSDITDPHNDSKHPDNLPQTPTLDFSVDSTAETEALDRMEMRFKKYPIWQPGKSERTFQACLVHGTWASIENVRKVSSSLLVNKPQCEHIADHFKVIGDVLQKLGLGKDFVSGQALEGGSGTQINLTFDETCFDHTAETFEKHFAECHSLRTTKFRYLSEVRKCLRKLPAMDNYSKESLSKSRRESLLGTSTKEKIKELSGYRVQHRLDKFLCLLFGVLKHGEDLVLFHSGLKGANNRVVDRTGMSCEKFVEIHELLYKLLDYYACLEHCDGTEFASGYLSRLDVCGAESILYYLNSNCFGENASLVISNNFLSIEIATSLPKMLKGPNCALKKLYIKSSPGVASDQEELCQRRLMIIAALSESVSLTSLTVCASNGKEMHELCKSLRANKVLENLVISAGGPLADNDAMNLSAMLKENRSLKSFTLEFDDVSPEGAVYLEAMLAEISLDEICLRGLGRVHFNYLLGLSMACMNGNRSVILCVEDRGSFLKIRRSGNYGMDGNQKLLIIKTLNRLSIKFGDLDLDAVCEIFDSLKRSKTLQLLEFEVRLPTCGDNCEVAACLEAFLAENCSLSELKVHFHVRDKSNVMHLLRPLMAEKDGESHVNVSLKKLHIVNYPGREMMYGESSPNDCGEAVECIAQMLRTNKTLSHFSMINTCLRTSDMCEIVDSLKMNKTLEVLHLEGPKLLDDPQVKKAFIDLLVHYNFTLRTINMGPMHHDIKSIRTFMTELERDIDMAQGGLQSLVCTTSDSPIVCSVLDVEQVVGTLQVEKGEGSTKERCRPSKMTFNKYMAKVEANDERPQLLLSYSKEMKDFASLVCEELKSSNYNVIDQDLINRVEVVDQCQLAIVVLSDMYLKSKPSMSELCTIVNSKKTNNPTLKVYPLLYKTTLHDLQNAYVHVSTLDGEGSSLDIALERGALDFLCEGKNEVSKKANHLVQNLRQGTVDVGKFCEEFSELQRSSWPTNGLEIEKNVVSKEGYVHTILEEILHYMPIVKECNNDEILWHQGKLEMESKLSLRQMKPLLESLLMRKFYLLRLFNMAQYLQEKYIQYSSFEEMCPVYMSREQKDEYGKGRIVAALVPTTFLYHFKVHMIQAPHDENICRMLRVVAGLVSEKMKKDFNNNGVQMSMFFDHVDYGAPLDLNPKRTIAVCRNFSTKPLDGSTQLVIVQDALIGAYYYQCVEASNLENLDIDETIGVIGVQVTSKEIHIDNIHEDGSSYSGVLGDFSYKIDLDENKQCAAKAFGDLGGARFLSKDSGIKCSPLLVIALASAIKRKGLTLTWRNGKGHIELYPKLVEVEVEVEAFACQIQYIHNIDLGVEIEWGTRSSSDAVYNAAAQNKMKYSCGGTILGHGGNISFEKRDRQAEKLMIISANDILKEHYEREGGFERNVNLDCVDHDLIHNLCRCHLHEEHACNYLVVSNPHLEGHVSVYKAIEHGGDVPSFDLIWITDILIKGGEEEIKRIFDIGLKGRELIVERKGSEFIQDEIPSQTPRKIAEYHESLVKILKKFLNKRMTLSMIDISKPNLVGMLKSKNEWKYIIGPRGKFETHHTYWWNATYMQAIAYSRTMYTSGKVLKTCSKLPIKGIGRIGFCSIVEDHSNEDKFAHLCAFVKSRAKFSRPHGSLLGNQVGWGGLEIGPELLENLNLQ